VVTITFEEKTIMRTTRAFLGILSAAVLGGCTANIHDNTVNIPNATLNVSTTADVDNVMPMQTVPMAVTVTNVTLIEPTATVPPEHIADAGHLVFTLDDEATPPILVTAETNVNITIPAATMEGKHKIHCRVHKHDNTPTDTHFEVEITVKVAVSTTTDGGTTTTTVDASVSVEAGTSTN